MRFVTLVVGVVVLLTSPLTGEEQRGQGRNEATGRESTSQVSVRVAFSSQDVQVIREYYAPRYRNLPPGLQKKLARTGTLPPGWQKKVEPFPTALEQRLVVLPRGYRRGVIDGNAVIYSPQGVVIDATVLF